MKYACLNHCNAGHRRSVMPLNSASSISQRPDTADRAMSTGNPTPFNTGSYAARNGFHPTPRLPGVQGLLALPDHALRGLPRSILPPLPRKLPGGAPQKYIMACLRMPKVQVNGRRDRARTVDPVIARLIGRTGD